MANNGFRASRPLGIGKGAHVPRQGMAYGVKFQGIALKISGSPADLASIPLQFDKGLSGVWVPTRILVRNVTSKDNSAAKIRLHTAAAGGGQALCAETTLTGLTGTVNQLQDVAVTLGGAAFTSEKIWLRQTVDSGNTGTIDVYVQFVDMTDYDAAYHTAL